MITLSRNLGHQNGQKPQPLATNWAQTEHLDNNGLTLQRWASNQAQAETKSCGVLQIFCGRCVLKFVLRMQWSVCIINRASLLSQAFFHRATDLGNLFAVRNSMQCVPMQPTQQWRWSLLEGMDRHPCMTFPPSSMLTSIS